MYILIIVLVIISIFFLIYTRTKNDGFKTKTKKDYLDGVDVIYWINLDRSLDRRQRMEQMFKDPVFKGKKIVRISAVDGKASNIDQVLNANFEGMQPDKFSKVEYACLLSHINAIKQFSESSDEVALIMEDDATLEYKPYWKKTVKQIMENAPNDWEIIQLCINTQKPLAKIYIRNSGHSQIFGTVTYVINKKCANHLKTHKMLQFSEHTADKYLYNQTITYAYKYPMFTYNYNENSTIHQDHINDHNRSKKIIDGFIQSSRSR
jgi:GR25 family glycosyltransferase involved in LPS biosynthesis